MKHIRSIELPVFVESIKAVQEGAAAEVTLTISPEGAAFFGRLMAEQPAHPRNIHVCPAMVLFKRRSQPKPA